MDGSFTHSGGALQETRAVGSNSMVNFLQIEDSSMAVQYRGVTLDTTSGGNDLGSVVVSVKAVDRVTEYCTVDGAASPDYAGRCFTITPANNLAANVTLWALTSEIPGTVTSPSAYHFSGGAWQELTNIATNTSDSYTWVSGDTTGFSSFLMAEAGGGDGAPTAVTLQSLTARTGYIYVVLLLGFLVLALGGVMLVWWHRRTPL